MGQIHIPYTQPTSLDTLMGPLHNADAVKTYLNGIEKVKAQGGEVLYGGIVDTCTLACMLAQYEHFSLPLQRR